jgi:ribosome-binding protein aMBF1 (putative translation factor)
MAETTDAIKILERITGNDSQLRSRIAAAKVNFKVAQMIHEARTKAGLSQRELAEMIGSRQPVIARLEDADYEGHSLTMLQRIAAALGQHLEVRFVPRPQKQTRRSHRKLQRSDEPPVAVIACASGGCESRRPIPVQSSGLKPRLASSELPPLCP